MSDAGVAGLTYEHVIGVQTIENHVLKNELALAQARIQELEAQLEGDDEEDEILELANREQRRKKGKVNNAH